MIENGKPEWIPFDLPTTEPVRGAILRETGASPEVEFDTDFRHVGVSLVDDPDRWRTTLEATGFRYPANTVMGPHGVAWVRPPLESLGDATHLLEMLHPLTHIEDREILASLPWPDPASGEHYRGLQGRCKAIHAEGKVAAGGRECTIFEHTWYLRGMDNVFCDWAEGNPITEWLLDYFTLRSIHECRAFVAAGCDVIRLGDDVGTQENLLISITMWREHLKPRLKQVVDAIREASGPRKVWVQYHSDGFITPLIPELIEIGIDILNPVQPECMDLEAVAAEFQDRLALCGMIGTQTTMPFGSPADVEEAVVRVRRLHSTGARVIVAPTHVLEPDVPMENIRAFANAAKHSL